MKKNKQRGEIATILTLISVGVMLLGVVVGNVAVQQATKTQPKAQGACTPGCVEPAACTANGGTPRSPSDSQSQACMVVNINNLHCDCPTAPDTSTPTSSPSPTATNTPPPAKKCEPKKCSNIIWLKDYLKEEIDEDKPWWESNEVCMYTNNECSGKCISDANESANYCKKSAPPPAASPPTPTPTPDTTRKTECENSGGICKIGSCGNGTTPLVKSCEGSSAGDANSLNCCVQTITDARTACKDSGGTCKESCDSAVEVPKVISCGGSNLGDANSLNCCMSKTAGPLPCTACDNSGKCLYYPERDQRSGRAYSGVTQCTDTGCVSGAECATNKTCHTNGQSCGEKNFVCCDEGKSLRCNSGNKCEPIPVEQPKCADFYDADNAKVQQKCKDACGGRGCEQVPFSGGFVTNCWRCNTQQYCGAFGNEACAAGAGKPTPLLTPSISPAPTGKVGNCNILSKIGDNHKDFTSTCASCILGKRSEWITSKVSTTNTPNPIRKRDNISDSCSNEQVIEYWCSEEDGQDGSAGDCQKTIDECNKQKEASKPICDVKPTIGPSPTGAAGCDDCWKCIWDNRSDIRKTSGLTNPSCTQINNAISGWCGGEKDAQADCAKMKSGDTCKKACSGSATPPTISDRNLLKECKNIKTDAITDDPCAKCVDGDISTRRNIKKPSEIITDASCTNRVQKVISWCAQNEGYCEQSINFCQSGGSCQAKNNGRDKILLSVMSYSNEGYNAFIDGVKTGLYNAIDASLYVMNATRAPGLQRFYCDPFAGQCDFYNQQSESQTLEDIYNLITSQFGKGIVDADGRIDLSKISDSTVRQQAQNYNTQIYTAAYCSTIQCTNLANQSGVSLTNCQNICNDTDMASTTVCQNKCTANGDTADKCTTFCNAIFTPPAAVGGGGTGKGSIGGGGTSYACGQDCDKTCGVGGSGKGCSDFCGNNPKDCDPEFRPAGTTVTDPGKGAPAAPAVQPPAPASGGAPAVQPPAPASDGQEACDNNGCVTQNPDGTWGKSRTSYIPSSAADCEGCHPQPMCNDKRLCTEGNGEPVIRTIPAPAGSTSNETGNETGNQMGNATANNTAGGAALNSTGNGTDNGTSNGTTGNGSSEGDSGNGTTDINPLAPVPMSFTQTLGSMWQSFISNIFKK